MSAPDTAFELELLATVLMAPADAFGSPELEAVRPDHFYDLAYRRAFAEAQRIHGEGGHVSPASIAARMNGDGPSEIELAQIATRFASALDVPALAERVRKDGEARNAKAALQRAYKQLDQGGDPAAVLARVAEMAPLSIRLDADLGSEVALAPDFVADRRERAPDLLPGHFRDERVGMIAGEVASGKTHLLLDLSLAAANGGAALGGVRFREAVSVLYCGGDNPRELLQDRLEELARGRGEELPLTLAMFEGTFNLAADEGAAKLRRLVDYTGARLVVLDLFTTYVSGVDENAAGEIAPVFVALRQISNATGCTFLLGHQLNKSGILAKAKDWLAAVRGSVGISGSVDFLYTMTQTGEWPSIVRTLRQRKNRDGQEADALSFTIEATEDGGRRLEWQAGHVTNADLEAAVLAYVQGHPGKNKSEIAAALGKGRTRTFKAVDALAKQGCVTLEKVGRGTVLVTASNAMQALL